MASKGLLEETLPSLRISMDGHYPNKVAGKNIPRTESQKIPGYHIKKLSWLLSWHGTLDRPASMSVYVCVFLCVWCCIVRCILDINRTNSWRPLWTMLRFELSCKFHLPNLNWMSASYLFFIWSNDKKLPHWNYYVLYWIYFIHRKT